MVTEVKPLQPRKAEPPMEVTVFGIVTEISWDFPKKARVSILTTVLGIIMTDSVPI